MSEIRSRNQLVERTNGGQQCLRLASSEKATNATTGRKAGGNFGKKWGLLAVFVNAFIVLHVTFRVYLQPQQQALKRALAVTNDPYHPTAWHAQSPEYLVKKTKNDDDLLENKERLEEEESGEGSPVNKKIKSEVLEKRERLEKMERKGGQQKKRKKQKPMYSKQEQRLQKESYDNIVHVIETPFMQYQGELTHLGKARLELLRTVTLPSLQFQTSHDFLWIIRVDPKLDQSLREELLQLLQEEGDHINLVVHAMNENPSFTDIAAAAAAAAPASDDELDTAQGLLKSYYEKSRTSVTLVTRLDPDDAIALDFVATVQKEASKMDMANTKVLVGDGNESGLPYFKVFCVKNHWEWQHYNPWLKRHKDKENDKRGALLGRSTEHCISAGLTTVFPVGLQRQDIPMDFTHNKLHKKLRSCRSGKKATTNYPCLQRISHRDGSPLAFRSWTVSSNSLVELSKVGINNKASRMFKGTYRYKKLQKVMWKVLPTTFGVLGHEIEKLRALIEEDAENILKDSVSGECLSDSSCRRKKRAQKTLDTMRLNGGKSE